jgi:hypothetical protein
MTTAIIGIGNIGGTVARELAAGGEQVVLSANDKDAVKKLVGEIGSAATAAKDNRDAVRGADNVVLALWLEPLRAVIEEVADLLPGKLVIDPSNPVSFSADGKMSRTLPDGQSSGEVVSGLLPPGARFAKAFGTLPAPMLGSGANREPARAVLFYATDDDTAAAATERLINTAGFEPVRVGGVASSIRIEMAGDLHAFGGLNGRYVDKAEAEKLVHATQRA